MWPYSFPNTRKDVFNDVPQAGESTCSALTKALLRLPLLLFQVLRQIIDENGNLTATFLSMIYTPGDIKIAFTAPNPSLQKGVWLQCDGAIYPKATYPDLYAAIGDIFATQTNPNVFTYDANGNKVLTTPPPVATGLFRVPDMRGLGPMGVGTLGSGATVTAGVAFGEEQHQITVEEMAPHFHYLANKDTPNGNGGSAPLNSGASFTDPGADASQVANLSESNVICTANSQNNFLMYNLLGSTNFPATLGQSSVEGGKVVGENSGGATAFTLGPDITVYYAAAPHNNIGPTIGCFFMIFAGVPVVTNTTSTDQTLTPI